MARDGGSISITVKRTGGSASGVTVNFATGDGTSHAGTDYSATAETLTFGAGETSKIVIIPILNNTLATGATTVVLTLSNPSGGASLGQSTAVLTIVAASSTPTPTSDSPSVVRLRRYGYHAQPTLLVLSFDQALDPTSSAERKETIGS